MVSVIKESDTEQTLLIFNYMHLISNTSRYAHQRVYVCCLCYLGKHEKIYNILSNIRYRK